MSRCVSEFIDESTNLFVDEFVADHSWINFSVYFDESGWRLKISVGGFFMHWWILVGLKMKKKIHPMGIALLHFFHLNASYRKSRIRDKFSCSGFEFLHDWLFTRTWPRSHCDWYNGDFNDPEVTKVLAFNAGLFPRSNSCIPVKCLGGKAFGVSKQSLDKCRFENNMISAMNFILLKKHLIKKLLSLWLIILQVMTKPINEKGSKLKLFPDS